MRRQKLTLGVALFLSQLLWCVIFAPLAAAELYCSPDRPVVFKGEVAELRAWSSQPDANLTYDWSAKVGRLGLLAWSASYTKLTNNQTSGAIWEFEGVDPGRYEVTVVAKTAERTESCTLEVFYQNAPELRGTDAVEVGRSLLVKGKSEPAGYGLYTYLLFGSPAEAGNSARYASALIAYWELAVPLEQMESYFERSQIDFLCVPVTENAHPKQRATPAELLNRYDFARARSLLDHVSNTLGEGPYLVSTLAPLGSGAAAMSDVLVQDLSGVPPEIIDLWVREFLNQAAQRHSWNVTEFRGFLLRVRTVIEILAAALPQVKEGLASYIKLVDIQK